MNRALIKQIGNWAGYLIVPLLIAGALLLVTYRRFDPPLILDLIALGVAAILYASTNPLALQGKLGKQMVGSSLSAIVVCLAAAGILVLVNILFQRISVRTDLTTTQQFSVTSATIDVLKKLKDPVDVLVFYSTDNGGDFNKSQVDDKLKEYTSRTDKLKVTYVDANFDPARVREYNIKALPTVVFQQGSKRQLVTTTDEQSFTRALLALQSNIQSRVFFVTGHQEPAITAGGSGDSFSKAVDALKNNNYLVDTINLFNLSTSGIITGTGDFKLNPASDVLVFGAPKSPLNDTEKQNALTFLRQGGKALFLNDPLSSAANQPVEKRNNINDLLKEWNLQFTAGLVVELDPQRRATNNPTIFLPQTVPGSDILRSLPDAPVVMSQSSQVSQAKVSGDTGTFSPLFQTSPNSYLKTDIQNLGQPFDASKDVRGPVTVAASYKAAAKEPPAGSQNLNTRLALVGNFSFASDDRSLGVDPSTGTANYFFFLNTMNWLAEQNDTVVIAPRADNSKPFAINQSQGSFIFWSTFLGLPILVLFIGLAVWWRRR